MSSRVFNEQHEDCQTTPLGLCSLQGGGCQKQLKTGQGTELQALVVGGEVGTPGNLRTGLREPRRNLRDGGIGGWSLGIQVSQGSWGECWGVRVERDLISLGDPQGRWGIW